MNHNRGFTLVEVLAAILILAIILPVFFQFFIFSQERTSDSQEKLVALNIAQKVLEQIKEDARTAEDEAQEAASPYWEVTHPSSSVSYPKTYDFTIQNHHVRVEVDKEVKEQPRLHMVKVSIFGRNGKLNSTVKGLVEI